MIEKGVYTFYLFSAREWDRKRKELVGIRFTQAEMLFKQEDVSCKLMQNGRETTTPPTPT